MNEDNLREALRTTMTVAGEPPPMESAAAVTAGRRAVRKRTALAGAGLTGVLVAVTALGIGIGLPGAGGRGSAPMGVAGQPSALPAPGDTKPTWPLDGDGQPQQDATARSGPRYEKGKQVLQGVLAAVPAGYTTPTGQTPDDVPMREHQAAVEGGPSWGYLGSAAVAKDGGTGRLLVEVHTPGNGMSGSPCALAGQFWKLTGECEVVTVGGAQVGVVVASGSDHRLDQWAAYRYPDGVVVYVAQSRNATNDSKPALAPLSKLPLTPDQLAAVAADARFHIK